MTAPEQPHPLPYRLPAIRHLHWLCHAPQLLGSDKTFHPGCWLPTDLSERLSDWDNHPERCPPALLEPPNRRLGHYFERLYRVLLEDVLNWTILAQNQQIRQQGRTIGELDFLIHNATEDRIEHHEIAVKFYLGYRKEQDDPVLWYGPNARDRLDLKTAHLIERQSQLTKRAETRELLDTLGISEAITPRIFMPGYLFYPQEDEFRPPASVPANHLRGQWLRAADLREPPKHWVPLHKPHWISPWQQHDSPDPQWTDSELENVRQGGAPRLFAALTHHPGAGVWEETGRVFVVPDHWPEESGPNGQAVSTASF